MTKLGRFLGFNGDGDEASAPFGRELEAPGAGEVTASPGLPWREGELHGESAGDFGSDEVAENFAFGSYELELPR
jgi:hypothetical protein